MIEKSKEEISKLIKSITIQQIDKEWDKLINIVNDGQIQLQSNRCRIGNNIVDYFTFTNRLETKGKYNVNYFEFIERIDEFKQKKFIKNMIEYYEGVKNKNKKKNQYIVWKEIYNICISAINIIRPIVYMEIYDKYKPRPRCILDFCAGWGGALIGACAMNIDKYIGIEINKDLEVPYQQMIDYLKNKGVKTDIQMYFKSALEVNYNELDYDFVFTSPPYYFIQKYKNNVEYSSKREMDELFYMPLFSRTYEGLKKGGYYLLNVNKEVYERVCVPLFGKANEIFPYKKSKRQNNYEELVYLWKKN